MKFISKRYVIKIPSEISVLYCNKTKHLLIKTKVSQKVLSLKVKIIILKEKNLLLVTNLPIQINSFKSIKNFKSLQGTTTSLIKKMFKEVLSIDCKKLKLVGVGYKVFTIKTEKLGLELLQFKLGYSHNIYYKIPKDISIKVRQSTKIFISGFDYNKVSQIAANLKNLKLPEPYKGKGILYFDEIIKLKEGKKI